MQTATGPFLIGRSADPPVQNRRLTIPHHADPPVQNRRLTIPHHADPPVQNRRLTHSITTTERQPTWH